MAKPKRHNWAFAPRFRRSAFGWRSQPAIQRAKEAVSEIKKAARKDPILGAEGAILFLEKVSAAIEHVDGSSGAMGAAVSRAIHALDDIPYIESLADYWGELCGSKEVASEWADRLLDTTRRALGPDRELVAAETFGKRFVNKILGRVGIS